MFDVFISYSTSNRIVADALKHSLEASGIRCWKAPDNILPGQVWEEAITVAIKSCKITLLIWSSDSQDSQQVQRELSLAANSGKVVIPYRIEDVEPAGLFEYYLTNTHWLDAYSQDVDKAICEVASRVSAILEVVDSVASTESDSLIPQEAAFPPCPLPTSADSKDTANADDGSERSDLNKAVAVVNNKPYTDKALEVRHLEVENLTAPPQLEAADEIAKELGATEAKIEKTIARMLREDGSNCLKSRYSLAVNKHVELRVARDHWLLDGDFEKLYLFAKQDLGSQSDGILLCDNLMSIKIGTYMLHVRYLEDGLGFRPEIRTGLFSISLKLYRAYFGREPGLLNREEKAVHSLKMKPRPAWAKEGNRGVLDEFLRLYIFLTERQCLLNGIIRPT